MYFNWRLITLQYCSVFLPYIHMNQQQVYMCSPSWTSHPSPFPSHYSGPSQRTSPEHPGSCIEPGLVISFTYDNVHVSMLFSQIIPPSPSHTESKKSVLYICVLSVSSSNCCFLTCIQISQEAGKVVWYSHLLKNFPQFVVIHTVKGFGIVSKAE